MFRLLIVALLSVSANAASAQFLTADQVRPILEATKGNWIGVRNWEGQDLLYFTHLESWRCGLMQVRYALNGSDDYIDYDLAECDETAPNPNAMPDGHLPYVTRAENSIETVTVEITYDDGKVVTETYARAAVAIP